jgi:hypothetical protein
LKRKEFLALKQGGMSMVEYRDKFIELSRYATEDVADDGRAVHGWISWTTSVPSYVSHLSVVSAADEQGNLLGVQMY